MKKILTIIIFISLIIFGGCGVKDGDKDTHYKPEEFKHNVAINQARNTMRDVEKELLDTKVGETSADVVYDIYNNSLKKLNDELTNLEKTKKLLSEDKELSKSEISQWNSSYEDSISAVKTDIASVEKQLADFLK
ncbi:MAG: hypothetical protein PHX40_02775 [Bacilli bacterium]|nr:hypothetical protein [Bacilli bacterium]